MRIVIVIGDENIRENARPFVNTAIVELGVSVLWFSNTTAAMDELAKGETDLVITTNAGYAGMLRSRGQEVLYQDSFTTISLCAAVVRESNKFIA